MFGLAAAGSESNVNAFTALIFRINWHHFKKSNLTLHIPTLLQYPKISSPTRSAGPWVCFRRLCVWGRGGWECLARGLGSGTPGWLRPATRHRLTMPLGRSLNFSITRLARQWRNNISTASNNKHTIIVDSQLKSSACPLMPKIYSKLGTRTAVENGIRNSKVPGPETLNTLLVHTHSCGIFCIYLIEAICVLKKGLSWVPSPFSKQKSIFKISI